MSVTPSTALGPTRAGDGPTRQGRLTTHEEQRQEVIRGLAKRASQRGSTEERESVVWPDGDETVMVVSFTVEHIDGEPIRILDRVVEYMPNGAELKRDPEIITRRLREDVARIFEKGAVQ